MSANFERGCHIGGFPNLEAFKSIQKPMLIHKRKTKTPRTLGVSQVWVRCSISCFATSCPPFRMVFWVFFLHPQWDLLSYINCSYPAISSSQVPHCSLTKHTYWENCTSLSHFFFRQYLKDIGGTSSIFARYSIVAQLPNKNPHPAPHPRNDNLTRLPPTMDQFLFMFFLGRGGH